MIREAPAWLGVALTDDSPADGIFEGHEGPLVGADFRGGRGGGLCGRYRPHLLRPVCGQRRPKRAAPLRQLAQLGAAGGGYGAMPRRVVELVAASGQVVDLFRTLGRRVSPVAPARPVRGTNRRAGPFIVP